MDRAWLKEQLGAGRSFESLGHELGRDPTTIGYWARKYGLVSEHALRHTPRGGISRERLAELVDRNLSIAGIATELGVSASTVQHWLRRHGLRTSRARNASLLEGGEIDRICRRHGLTLFVRYGPKDHFRCLQCRRERVSARRRRVKEILVEEAGGRCLACGYGRYVGALQFHHVDPDEKEFGLAAGGVARSLARCRSEVSKCVLLCANCHAEIEAGVAELPLRD